MFRPMMSIAAALLAIVVVAGQPDKASPGEPAPPAPVVTETAPPVTSQTVTINCPETYYETETRTRMVKRTRMVPVTEEVPETYTVQVPKTRMVPRTFTIGCPSCQTTVDTAPAVVDVGPQRLGCLQRLRNRRLARMGRYNE